MSRRSLLALLAIPVFFLAAVPAFAKKHTKKVPAPVVRSIHPLKLKIGEKLTIHGKYFLKGRHKDTIVFLGAGKRVVWVKADKASTSTITVKLPTKLAVLLANKGGAQKATRLRDARHREEVGSLLHRAAQVAHRVPERHRRRHGGGRGLPGRRASRRATVTATC